MELFTVEVMEEVIAPNVIDSICNAISDFCQGVVDGFVNGGLF